MVHVRTTESTVIFEDSTLSLLEISCSIIPLAVWTEQEPLKLEMYSLKSSTSEWKTDGSTGWRTTCLDRILEVYCSSCAMADESSSENE